MPPLRPSPGSPSPAPSRVRHWAARLALLVACVGAVATSDPYSPALYAEYTGQPLRLTAANPVATRHVVIRAFFRNVSDEFTGYSVARLTPRWQPTDSGTQPPSLHVRWRVGEQDSGPSTTIVLSEPASGENGELQLYESATRELPNDCTLDAGCEWNAVLEVEVQGELDEAVVDVDWGVRASVKVDDTDEVHEDFRLEILEP